MSWGILYRNTTLVAALGNVVSGWIDTRNMPAVTVLRTATAGAYAFEIDWSNDGSTVDVVQAVTVGNNSQVRVDVAHSFARFRVRNTDAALPFTAHATVVRLAV